MGAEKKYYTNLSHIQALRAVAAMTVHCIIKDSLYIVALSGLIIGMRLIKKLASRQNYDLASLIGQQWGAWEIVLVYLLVLRITVNGDSSNAVLSTEDWQESRGRRGLMYYLIK